MLIHTEGNLKQEDNTEVQDLRMFKKPNARKGYTSTTT